MLDLFLACEGIERQRFAPLRIGQSLLVPPYAAVAQDKGSKRKRQCDWRAIRALE